ncbi:MAG: hypothetical protein PHY14_04980 [Candidatus Gracilibacteria bacterium]|nr:hypothetical protein [Candidatus Gracilibacteria bacterium]
MLGEDLYQLEKVEHLCSTWDEIPGRKKGKDGDVYTGVKQLEKFIKMPDRVFLQEKLGLDVPINNIHGVFVTTKAAIGWNAIMKSILSGKISLGDNEYSFASLGEIEHLLGMACEKGIPFDEILLRKQRPSLDILDPLHIVIGRLSTNDAVLHNKSFSYTDSIYQDFDVFLNSTYGKGNGFFPLSPEDTSFEGLLKEILEEDNTDNIS